MIEKEVESLRNDIAALWQKRVRGDLPERMFRKQSEERVRDLCRLLVRSRLEQGENILSEHHVVRAHTKMAGSVLRESEQEFISLLATERRLFRLRSTLTDDQPILFSEDGRDAVEVLSYESLSGVAVRRQRRIGEIIAGLAIVFFAILGHPWLQITGTALFLLGIAGALHGLLLPTRWAEVVERTPSVSPPFQIWALRKKSARNLLRFLRRSIPRR
jgi:hypothetical protein